MSAQQPGEGLGTFTSKWDRSGLLLAPITPPTDEEIEAVRQNLASAAIRKGAEGDLGDVLAMLGLDSTLGEGSE